MATSVYGGPSYYIAGNTPTPVPTPGLPTPNPSQPSQPPSSGNSPVPLPTPVITPTSPFPGSGSGSPVGKLPGISYPMPPGTFNPYTPPQQNAPTPQQPSNGGGGGGGQSNFWSDSENKGYWNGTWFNDKNDWLKAGGSSMGPSIEDQQNALRGEIGGAYDSYFKQLDEMMGGLGNQQNNYNQQIDNSYNQNVNDLTSQKNMGMADLGTQRNKNQQQQVKNLRDIADNIRSLFRTGNVMLGTRGAGDSSAANQYAYAVTKVGSKERGNVMDQTRSIENDIAGREARLNEVYTTEKSRLATEKQNQILSIANQFEQARQNLMQAKAQGQLEKGVSLANLSRELLNQATQRMMQIDADIRNRANMLDQWAMNNSTSLAQLKQNMGAVSGYKAPNVQANAIMGTPQFDASGNMQTSLRPATGYSTMSTSSEEKQPTGLQDMAKLFRTA